jgi:hypothetical protein
MRPIRLAIVAALLASETVSALAQSNYPDRNIRPPFGFAAARRNRSILVGRTQQQRIERRHHLAASNRFKFKQTGDTLCRHRGAPRIRREMAATQRFSLIRRPDEQLGM